MGLDAISETLQIANYKQMIPEIRQPTHWSPARASFRVNLKKKKWIARVILEFLFC